MKKYFILFFLFFSFLSSVYGYDKIKVPFKTGEYLEYEVQLFSKTVAIQKVWVLGIVDVNGQQCYHIRADVETVPWVSKVYHLHDVFNEYLEVDTLRPVKIEGKKKEGNWTNTVFSDIDRKNKIIHFRDTRNAKDTDIPYQGDVVGLVSILFYARTYTPVKNEQFTIGLCIDDKIEYVTVVAKETTESLFIKQLKKKFITFLYQQVGGRNVGLWISNDNNRLPVRLISVRLKLAGYGITNIEAWLSKYKP